MAAMGSMRQGNEGECTEGGVVWLQLSNLCLDHVYCVALFFSFQLFPMARQSFLNPS